MGQITHTTDEGFEREVLQADLPLLVDFWAEWCGPCKMIAPILEELATAYDGRLKITKLNVDENQRTPASFHIRGIPTLLLFKNGRVTAQKAGALSKSALLAFLDGQIQQPLEA